MPLERKSAKIKLILFFFKNVEADVRRELGSKLGFLLFFRAWFSLLHNKVNKYNVLLVGTLFIFL